MSGSAYSLGQCPLASAVPD